MMSEWWTYRPEDFLLFSPRVYWRLFEVHNARSWPLHLLTLAAGLAMILAAFRRISGIGVGSALLLAALWILVGWSFLWNRYAAINWAIAYMAPIFGLEALLLVIAAARGGLAFGRQDAAARAGLLVAGFGIVVYPVLPALFGRSWSESEVFGIAPDPTVLATLGLLLAASGRLPLLLLPVPLAWLLLSGLTLSTMGDPQGWIAFLALGAAVVILALRWRRS